MKYLLLALPLLCLSACNFTSSVETNETDPIYDETTYYYWPTTAQPELIYEILQNENDGFASEFPQIANLEPEHPLVTAINTPYRQAEAQHQRDQKEAHLDHDALSWDYSVGWLGGNYHPDLWSLAFQVYNYTGGAHGNHWTDTFNYNPNRQQLLKLDDLLIDPLYEPVLAEAIYAEVVKAKQARQPSGEVYNPEKDFFLQDVAFTGEQISRWVVAQQEEKTGLLFFFPPYDIGPYAEGGYEVFVPASFFIDWVAPQYQAVFNQN